MMQSPLGLLTAERGRLGGAGPASHTICAAPRNETVATSPSSPLPQRRRGAVSGPFTASGGPPHSQSLSPRGGEGDPVGRAFHGRAHRLTPTTEILLTVVRQEVWVARRFNPSRGRDILWDAVPRAATQDGGASQPWAK